MAPITSDHIVLVAVIAIVVMGAGASIQFAFLGESIGTTETAVDYSLIVPEGGFTTGHIDASNRIAEVSNDGVQFRFGFEAEEHEEVTVLLPIENLARVDLVGAIDLDQTHGSQGTPIHLRSTSETWGNDCTIDETVQTADRRWEFAANRFCQDYVEFVISVPTNSSGTYVYEGTITSIGQTGFGIDDGDDPSGSLDFHDQQLSEEDEVTVSNVSFMDVSGNEIFVAIENEAGTEIGGQTITSSGNHEISIDRSSFDSGEELVAIMYEDTSRDVILDSDRAQVTTSGEVVITAASSNEPITEGESLEVDVSLENIGGDPAERSITLAIDGDIVDTEDVSIAPGEADQITLTWGTAAGDEGDRTVTIDTGDHQESFDVTVNPDESDISVDITGTNSPVTEGEGLDITAELENVGENGIQEVELVVNDVVRDSHTVELDSGETTSQTFTWNTEFGDAGAYDAIIQSRTDDASVSVTVNESDEEPYFVVSITGTNSPVTEGETLSVDATIENTAGIAATQDVTLEIDGTIRDTKAVSLGGEDSTDVILEWDTEEGDAGTFSAIVASDDDDDTTDVSVDEPTPPYFDVTLTETNSPIVAGATLSVTADVENTGEQPGEQDITLDIDGTTVDAEVVGLEPGASQSVSLTWETSENDAGNYTASMHSANTSDETDVRVLEPPEFLVNIEEANDPITEGEILEVSTTLENVGEVADQQTVELEIDGIVRDEITLSLDPEETQSIVLEWETGEGDAGEYDAIVRSEDDEDSVAILIDAPLGEQVQYESGSARTISVNSEFEFEITSSAATDGDLVGIAVNQSSNGAFIENEDDGTLRSPDAPGYYEGVIEIGGPAVELQEPITMASEETTVFHIGQFRSGANNDPVNMVNEEVTITLYFGDGSEYQFDISNVNPSS